MPESARRSLELLRLGRPLRRYAGRLTADANASAFLVHKALMAAFAEPLAQRRGDCLEGSLRQDIDRGFALGKPSAEQAPMIGPAAGVM